MSIGRHHHWQRYFFTVRQQQIFLEDIHALLEDGVPLNQAVQTLLRLSRGSMLLLLQEVSQALASGRLFADALEGWFAPHLVTIIRAGERGGVFVDTVHAAQAALMEQTQVWSKVVATLAYPLLVLLMGCGVAVFIQQSVLSSFAQIKAIDTWPELGQWLYVGAQWLQHDAFWVLALVIAIGLALVWLLRCYVGSLRHFLDHLPIFSAYRRLMAARMMEAMGLMLSNGLVLRDVIQLSQEGATVYLRWHLLHMEQRLSSGYESIAAVLQTGLLHEHELARLRVVAQGGGFAAAMLRLGRRANVRVQQSIVRSARLLSGALLVLAACFAALMVFAIYGVGSYIGT